MNKTAVVVLALGGVSLGVTGASAWAGRAVLARLSQQTTAATQLFPSFKAEEKIDAGLFRSTRTVTLKLGCISIPGADDKAVQRVPLTLRWRDQIQHGPFPGGKSFGAAVIDSELLTPDAWAKQAAEMFGKQPLLSAHTRVSMGGGFDSDLKVPAFSFKSAKGDKVEGSSIKAHVQGNMPASAGTATYAGTVDPFSVSFDGAEGAGKLSFGSARMRGKMQLDPSAPSFVFPFESEGQVDAIKVTAKSDQLSLSDKSLDLTLSKLTAKSEATLDKQLWSSSNTLSGALRVNGFTIDKLELTSALRRVHAPTYAKLMRQLLETTLSCDQSVNLADPLAAFDSMQEDLFALLTHDPEYAVGPIAMELSGKRAEISYSLGVRGITPADAKLPLALLLPQKGVVHAEARAHLGLIDELATFAAHAMGDLLPGAGAGQGDPKASAAASAQATRMARTLIDQFVQQGYLVREGETIRAAVESVAGEIKLNGKPFALSDFAGVGGP